MILLRLWPWYRISVTLIGLTDMVDSRVAGHPRAAWPVDTSANARATESYAIQLGGKSLFLLYHWIGALLLICGHKLASRRSQPQKSSLDFFSFVQPLELIGAGQAMDVCAGHGLHELDVDLLATVSNDTFCLISL